MSPKTWNYILCRPLTPKSTNVYLELFLICFRSEMVLEFCIFPSWFSQDDKIIFLLGKAKFI